jgi:hypothetical protein
MQPVTLEKGGAMPTGNAAINSASVQALSDVIFALRSSGTYHAAAVDLANSDALTMAASADASLRGKVTLMIGTWEHIGSLMKPILKAKKKSLKRGFDKKAKKDIDQALDIIFKRHPVGFMRDSLEPGIDYISSTTSGYAKSFKDLADVYDTWLSAQPGGYRSSARSGLNAMFG